MEDVNITVAAEEESYEELRRKYLKHNYGSGDKRTLTNLICDGIALAAVLIVSLTTLLFFAKPYTLIGGQSYGGKTYNIFSFIYFSDDSMFIKIKNFMDSSSDIQITNSLNMVRYGVILIIACVTLIKSFYCTINAVIKFFKKNSKGLISCSITNIKYNLMPYIVFSYIGSRAGGTGSTKYYVGYICGTGMTVGTIIGVLLIVSVAVIKLILNREKIRETDKIKDCIHTLISFVCYFSICIAVTQLWLFNVFYYIFSNVLSTILVSIISDFKINSLIFAAGNIFILYYAIWLYQRALFMVSSDMNYIANLEMLENTEDVSVQNRKKKKFSKNQTKGFILVIILAAIALILAYILNMPQLGFGWAVDINAPTIAILIIGIIGQIAKIVLNKVKFNSKKPSI